MTNEINTFKNIYFSDSIHSNHFKMRKFPMKFTLLQLKILCFFHNSLHYLETMAKRVSIETTWKMCSM